MKQDIKVQLLTKRPIDLLFQLSVPAVIGMIVIGMYPLLDGIFAGNIIGQNAMTACGVAAPLTFFNSGAATLVGVGSASILSRAIGKDDRKTVDKVMGNLVFWVIIFLTRDLSEASMNKTLQSISTFFLRLCMHDLRSSKKSPPLISTTNAAFSILRSDDIVSSMKLFISAGGMLSIQ